MLCVVGPRAWLGMCWHKSDGKKGWWVEVQLVRRWVLKCGGRWRIWMYLSVQSVSRSWFWFWFWFWGVVLWRSVSVVMRRMRSVVCGGGMVVLGEVVRGRG